MTINTSFFIKLCIMVGVGALAAAFIFFGIARKNTSDKKSDPYAGTSITIGGSKAVAPVLGKLFADAYSAAYPERRVVHNQPSHTGGAIQGVAEGVLAIGFTSRLLTSKELSSFPDIRYQTLCKDGLVFAISRNVGVSALTAEQIRAIYAGTITNWKTVGGPNIPIAVLDRSEESSAKIALRTEQKFFPTDFIISSRAISLGTPDEMDTALASTEYAIGYTSFGTMKLKNLPVVAIAIDGVQPTESSIQDGTYPLYREFGYVTKGAPTGAAEEFIVFMNGQIGRNIMTDHGFILP